MSTGIYSTGMRNGLQIMTNNRELVLKSWTRRKAKEWMSYLKAVANNQARDFTCPNPHMVRTLQSAFDVIFKKKFVILSPMLQFVRPCVLIGSLTVRPT